MRGLFICTFPDCSTDDGYEAPDHATNQCSLNPVICNAQVNCSYKLQDPNREGGKRGLKATETHGVKQHWLIIKYQLWFRESGGGSSIRMQSKCPTQLIPCGRS